MCLPLDLPAAYTRACQDIAFPLVDSFVIRHFTANTQIARRVSRSRTSPHDREHKPFQRGETLGDGVEEPQGAKGLVVVAPRDVLYRSRIALIASHARSPPIPIMEARKSPGCRASSPN